MPQPRSAVTGITCTNKFFVFGGYKESRNCEAIFSYEPRMNKWEELGNLECSKHALNVVSFYI